ncbi:MAG: phytanoyl-CoA dioxygenase family protein, partial [Cyclobacteriaceae bacterium]
PVKAGEILIFDCRTVHAAVPNLTNRERIAVSFSLTPRDAQLYHHILVSEDPINRKIAKVKVDREFFSHYSVERAHELYEARQLPTGYEVEEYYEDTYEPHSEAYINEMAEKEHLKTNGKRLHTMDQ